MSRVVRAVAIMRRRGGLEEVQPLVLYREVIREQSAREVFEDGRALLIAPAVVVVGRNDEVFAAVQDQPRKQVPLVDSRRGKDGVESGPRKRCVLPQIREDC